MKKLNIHILEDKKPIYIHYGCCTTTYGKIILFCMKRGIYGLHFLIYSINYHLNLAQEKFPYAIFTDNPSLAKQWWKRIIDPKKTIPVFLQGTTFQKKIWASLIHIPLGKTTFYQKIAEELGMKSSSARAVANAIAQNFIAILIPCHRVVQKSGHLGGYRWGDQKKSKLLISEKNQTTT